MNVQENITYSSMQSHLLLLLMFILWLLILEQRETLKDHSRATKEQQNMHTIRIKENHHVYLLTC